MAKKKDKNTAKSLVMVIITGITLVAVTLCWFAIMDRASMAEEQKGTVLNEVSTFANIYFGADANGEIAITPESIKQYVKIDSREIILENMFPGAEYTYMAEFRNAKEDYIITLDLNDIENMFGGNLTSKVKLNRRVTLMSGDSGNKETTSQEPSYKLQADEIFLSNESALTFKVPKDGRYRVYFSFKIDENVTVENGRNMSIEIKNVDAIISSGT